MTWSAWFDQVSTLVATRAIDGALSSAGLVGVAWVRIRRPVPAITAIGSSPSSS